MDKQKNQRLEAIIEKLGLAVLQLQVLEDVTANHYILVSLVTPGMGLENLKEVLRSTEKFTFGTTIKALCKAGKMPEELKKRYWALLEERNWLVHGSRDTCDFAIYDDSATEQMLNRLAALLAETEFLVFAIMNEGDKFTLQHGISNEDVKHEAEKMLAAWKSGVEVDLWNL